MAVTGKGPAPREVPFALLTDTADAEAEGRAVAEKLSKFMNFAQGKLSARPEPAASQEGDAYWATDDLTYGPTGTVYILYGGVWNVFPLPSVVTAMIANLAVTAAKLGPEAVEPGKIQALAVTEPKLGNEAVSTGKIANLAVTAAKIAASAIETAKIKAGAITEALLAGEAVTAAKIAAGAVTDAKIQAGRQLMTTTNAYSARVERALETAFEPSSTRFTFVIVDVQLNASSGFGRSCSAEVGGVQVAEIFQSETSSGQVRGSMSFLVPPGKTWFVTNPGGVSSLHSSYLFL